MTGGVGKRGRGIIGSRRWRTGWRMREQGSIVGKNGGGWGVKEVLNVDEGGGIKNG